MDIENIHLIKHPQLVCDIKSLISELMDKIVELEYENSSSLNRIIQNYVMGINRPICICDGRVFSTPGGEFEVELLVDYRVTYGYKPNQSIDDDIHLYCTINKSIIRNKRLNELI